MDICSLEDDDVGNMFITQEPWNVNGNLPNFDLRSGFEPEGLHLSQPNSDNVGQYSDISDDDLMEIPSSQVNTNKQNERYVS